MDRFNLNLLQKARHRKQWTVISTALAGIIVFITTYSLILPAATLEADVAENELGIFLDMEDDDMVLDDTSEASAPSGETVTADSASQEADAVLTDDDDWDIIIDEDEIYSNGLPMEETDAPEETSYTIRELRADAEGSDPLGLHLTFGADAGIPDGTKLEYTQILPAEKMNSAAGFGQQYETYRSAAEAAIRSAYRDWLLSGIALYDISLIKDGAAIEPDSTVTVEMNLRQPIYAGRIELVHFAGETKDTASAKTPVIETISTKRAQDGGICQIRFETKHFSVFGLVLLDAAAEETEALTEAVTETETETEALTEEATETETETEALTEEATETETETEALTEEATEIETETETEALEEEETEEETEALTEEETEEETEVLTEEETEEETETPAEEWKAGILTAEGEGYEVVVSYGPEAQIPDAAILQVTEITEEASAYENWMSMAEEALNVNGNTDAEMAYARFFDIKIMSGESEIEPAAPVQVRIRLTDEDETSGDASIHTLRLTEDGPEKIHANTEEDISFEVEEL